MFNPTSYPTHTLPMEFTSRRSVVHSTKGIAGSTQPLATAVAIKLLDRGCNAAEAAVGCSAALAVTEPAMTSLGDAFCINYDHSTGKVQGFNGSGKSSRNTDLKAVKEAVGKEREFLPLDSALAVTVPGAAQAWIDIVEKFGTGKFTIGQILAPAIELARNGFPVSEVMGATWKRSEQKLAGSGLLVDGKRAPEVGEIFKNEDLAKVLDRIAEHGRDGFYSGPTADAIVESIQSRGGLLDHEDLKLHKSLEVETISTPVASTPVESAARLWELPPNNHGIVAILAMNIINQITTKLHPELANVEHNSFEYIHLITEAFKFAFKDAEHYVADPETHGLPKELLTEEYAFSRAQLFDPHKANQSYEHGDVIPVEARSDTSYYAVVDKDGNACSMISSLYHAFGTGIVPNGLGFALHNRGCNFSLDPESANALGPSKRPYHTIIPAMLTNSDGSLLGPFGVMGGFMQPQGHIQVALNLLKFKFDPQKCIDAPRICLEPTSELRGGIPVPDPTAPPGSASVVVNLEEGISPRVGEQLQKMGHSIKFVSGAARALFGRGQLITRDVQKGRAAVHAGSDPRGDGCAIPQI